MEMVRFRIGHDRSIYTQQRQCGHTMDGLGDRHRELFDLDLHGHQGRRHPQGFDGGHVPAVGFEGDLELARLITTQKTNRINISSKINSS